MIPPSANDRRGRRAQLALVAVAAVAVVLLAADLGVHAPRLDGGPLGSASPTGPVPIATGAVVEPSGPGQTAVIAADSVPLSRPTFAFRGPQPWQIQAPPTATKVLEGY